jgi:glycosyltransferase involved in cell wall biosynthesis
MKASGKRVLLFIKVPPPITGVTIMNKQILDSALLKENFNIRSISISYATSINDLGKFNFKKFKTFLRIFNSLFKECFYNRPQFVYFQVSPLGISFYRDILFISLIKIFKIKIVFHLHGKGIIKKGEHSFSTKLYRYAFRNAEIISLSEMIKDDLKYVYNGPVYIVNNGISVISVNKLHIDKKFKKNLNIKILFLSNLLISKGILDFIEALKILDSRKIDFKADIVGAEGDIKASDILNKIEEYKLGSKVYYSGPKYEEEKNEIISQCDVLIYPSLDDSFPIVLLEVMQFGKPIIATIEGGIPDIIDDGITGIMVPKHNPKEIADKLEILINDSELRKKMGASGRDKFLRKYTQDIFESNMQKVFTKVLE